MSGPFTEDPRYSEPVVNDEVEERGEEEPRVIWGQGTHFAGVVDTVNPGHFDRPGGSVEDSE